MLRLLISRSLRETRTTLAHMKTRRMSRVAARNTWDRLEVSFWFAPAVMALGAVLLAWTMYWVDGRIPNEVLEKAVSCWPARRVNCAPPC